ncbi:hypothetical protein SLEP1_g45820 [Rubroshorea leprosula]|uniref:Uncharacterized protein n=1 Tax=Rubroshorea leprosula TaxID=152421 RepID=A0AAV5LL40_9ROSI|nr:hypothetical protein SLEP1_g45820 [Rubroshorea leprosula]
MITVLQRPPGLCIGNYSLHYSRHHLACFKSMSSRRPRRRRLPYSSCNIRCSSSAAPSPPPSPVDKVCFRLHSSLHFLSPALNILILIGGGGGFAEESTSNKHAASEILEGGGSVLVFG